MVSSSLYLSPCHWVISSVISSFLRQIYIKERPGHSSLMLFFPYVMVSFHLYYLFIHNLSPQLECNFPVGKDCIIHYCNAWCPQKRQIHIRYLKVYFEQINKLGSIIIPVQENKWKADHPLILLS